MSALKSYTLPILGLKNGVHRYKFDVDSVFFSHFEGSPIENGRFDLSVELDKRDSFFELIFDFEGYAETECDPSKGNLIFAVQRSHSVSA